MLELTFSRLSPVLGLTIICSLYFTSVLALSDLITETTGNDLPLLTTETPTFVQIVSDDSRRTTDNISDVAVPLISNGSLAEALFSVPEPRNVSTQFPVRLKFEQMTWTDAYNNKSSEEYGILKNTTLSMIDVVFSNTTTYIRSEVLGFSPGSIIAHIEITFNSTAEDQEALDLLINEILTNASRDVWSDISLIKETTTTPLVTLLTTPATTPSQSITTVPSQTSVQLYVHDNVTIVIASWTWTDDLTNSSSPGYRTLKDQLMLWLNEIFKSYPSYREAKITHVRSSNNDTVLTLQLIFSEANLTSEEIYVALKNSSHFLPWNETYPFITTDFSAFNVTVSPVSENVSTSLVTTSGLINQTTTGSRGQGQDTITTQPTLAKATVLNVTDAVNMTEFLTSDLDTTAVSLVMTTLAPQNVTSSQPMTSQMPVNVTVYEPANSTSVFVNTTTPVENTTATDMNMFNTTAQIYRNTSSVDGTMMANVNLTSMIDNTTVSHANITSFIENTTAAILNTTSTFPIDNTTSTHVNATLLFDNTTLSPLNATSSIDNTTSAYVNATLLFDNTTLSPLNTTSSIDNTTSTDVNATLLFDNTTLSPLNTTSSIDNTTSAHVNATLLFDNTTLSPLNTTSSIDNTTSAHVNATLLFDNTTLSPLNTTSSIDNTTSAHVNATLLFDNTTLSPLNTTSSIDNTTSTDVNATLLFDNTTLSPLNTTSSIDNTTSTDVNATLLFDNTTLSPLNTTSSIDNTTSAHVNATLLFDNTTLSPLNTTSSIDNTTSAHVNATLLFDNTTFSPNNTTFFTLTTVNTTAAIDNTTASFLAITTLSQMNTTDHNMTTISSLHISDGGTNMTESTTTAVINDTLAWPSASQNQTTMAYENVTLSTYWAFPNTTTVENTTASINYTLPHDNSTFVVTVVTAHPDNSTLAAENVTAYYNTSLPFLENVTSTVAPQSNSSTTVQFVTTANFSDPNTTTTFSSYESSTQEFNMTLSPRKVFNVKLTISGMSYTDDYKNASSEAYTNLQKQIIDKMQEIFQNYYSYHSAKILSFSQGSVVVNMALTFDNISVSGSDVHSRLVAAQPFNATAVQVVEEGSVVAVGSTTEGVSTNSQPDVITPAFAATTVSSTWASGNWTDLYTTASQNITDVTTLGHQNVTDQITTAYPNVTDFSTTAYPNVTIQITTAYPNVTDFNATTLQNVTMQITTAYPNVTDFNTTTHVNVTAGVTIAYPNVTDFNTTFDYNVTQFTAVTTVPMANATFTTVITTVTSTSPSDVRVFSVKFRITNLNWTEQYKNSSSFEYNNLGQEFTNKIKEAFKRFGSFVQSTILGLSQGSVVVDFQLSFGGNISIDEIMEALKNISDWQIDPGSIVINDTVSSTTTVPTTSLSSSTGLTVENTTTSPLSTTVVNVTGEENLTTGVVGVTTGSPTVNVTEAQNLTTTIATSSSTSSAGNFTLSTINVTDSQVNVTESTVNVTDSPVSVTESTANVTYLPVNVTESTANVTESTANVTYSTVNVTVSTANVTESTASVTQSPVNVTQSTANITETTVNVTLSPVNVTESTVNVTYSTANVTYSPVNVTESTVNVTYSTAYVTESSANVTESTSSVTQSPVINVTQSTDNVTESTANVTESTSGYTTTMTTNVTHPATNETESTTLVTPTANITTKLTTAANLTGPTASTPNVTTNATEPSSITPTITASVTTIPLVPVLTFQGKFTITQGMDWSEDLANMDSEPAKRLKLDIENRLKALYARIPGFKNVKVLLFSKGSVIVTTELTFETKDVGPDNATNTFKAYLSDNNSKLGYLTIDNESVQHAEVKALPSSDSDKFPDWAIAVIVCGGCLILFVICMTIILCCRRTHKRKYFFEDDPEDMRYRRSWASQDTSVPSQADDVYDVYDSSGLNHYKQPHRNQDSRNIPLSEKKGNGHDNPYHHLNKGEVNYGYSEPIINSQAPENGHAGNHDTNGGEPKKIKVYKEGDTVTYHDLLKDAWETRL